MAFSIHTAMAAALVVASLFGGCAGDAVFRVSMTGAAGHHRSLRAARDAVREHRRRSSQSQSSTSRVTVVIEPGVYELTEPLVLEEQDSWTTWTAAAGSTTRPVHSGGRRLTGTWQAPAKAGAPWTLSLPVDTPRFNQLFVSGQRAMRAREPEWGSFFQMDAKLPPPHASLGFKYRNSDLSALVGTEGAGGSELVVYDSWKASRRNILKVNTSDSSVLLTSGCAIAIEPYANSGSRYYAENFEAACDSPNEWYFDEKGSKLHWQPRHVAEDPNALEFIAPHISGDLLELDGARMVTIESQSFMHADWSIGTLSGGGTNVSSGNCQAASFLSTAAVHLRNSSGCIWRNNTVEHVGEYGIWIENASSHNLIDSSLVRDTGAGGLRIGVGKPLVPEIGGIDGSDHNTITDSTFVQGSMVYHEGNGVLLQKVSYTTVKNCEVAYYNHVGISIGWTWQYLNGSSEAHHNIITDCHAHHFGNGDLSDLAGIYFLGVSPGSGAYGNHIHDSYPYFQYGHGIYTDQASSDVMINGNLAHHTEGATMYQHYGHNISIENNIFALATGGVGEVWQHGNTGSATPEGVSDLRFKQNIVYVDARVGSGLFGTSWLGNSSFSKNLYYNASSTGVEAALIGGRQFPTWKEGTRHGRPGSSSGACNRTFAEWQASGEDAGSMLNVDPDFASKIPRRPADFRIGADSPARNLGFNPELLTAIVGQVGPKASAQFPWQPQCHSDSSTHDTDKVFTCSDPSVPVNGSVSGNGHWGCGDVAVWHCEPGTVLTGATFAYCLANGWTSPAPKCVAAPRPTCLSSSDGDTNHLTSGTSLSTLRAPAGQYFVTQQSDGNVCVYKGSGPAHNQGEVWCSGGDTVGPGQYSTVLQTDGNLCTYRLSASQDSASVWCSDTPVCAEHPCQLWAALQDDGRFCVHRGATCTNGHDTTEPVWCSAAPHSAGTEYRSGTAALGGMGTAELPRPVRFGSQPV